MDNKDLTRAEGVRETSYTAGDRIVQVKYTGGERLPEVRSVWYNAHNSRTQSYN